MREKIINEQWYYITTKNNPADLATCYDVLETLLKSKQWFNYPKYKLMSRIESQPKLQTSNNKDKKTLFMKNKQ